MLPRLTRFISLPTAGIGLLVLAIGPAPVSPMSAVKPSSGHHSGQRPVVPWSAGSTPFPSVQPAAYDVHDPATWSNRELAAQLTVSCVDVHDVRRARRQTEAGIGGITLLGSRPDRHLAKRLGAGRRAAPHHLSPFIMSDEEGGRVQRLRSAIYPLPSAQKMGHWRAAHLRRTARKYGVRMRALGVRMNLAPVADLAVKGAYIASLHRALSRNPKKVASRARAWRQGMHEAGVASVIKHWPGHGSAGNSHTGPASVPPLATLERRDMRPFDIELSHGARVVMVGHLRSKGLTEPGVPASESTRALHYLREAAGPDVVILTDALDMAAASRSLGLSPSAAAVRSLRAGADWALVCGHHPLRGVARIRAAIASGALPRVQVEASARRIVTLKSSYGLAPR